MQYWFLAMTWKSNKGNGINAHHYKRWRIMNKYIGEKKIHNRSFVTFNSFEFKKICFIRHSILAGTNVLATWWCIQVSGRSMAKQTTTWRIIHKNCTKKPLVLQPRRLRLRFKRICHSTFGLANELTRGQRSILLYQHNTHSGAPSRKTVTAIWIELRGYQ